LELEKTMEQVTIKANAKINLSLDVIGKRPDGYHEVRMVMQQIDLFDLVTVSYDPQENGTESLAIPPNASLSIALTTTHPDLPAGIGNIAYDAASLVAMTCDDRGYPRNGSIRIHIDKKIPLAAGLAGGSSDAAAVLLALNGLWSLNYSLDELMILGKKLGADVPFCIMGNAGIATCALAEGIGEKLTPITRTDGERLTTFDNCRVLLSKPPISVSTAKIYGGLVLSDHLKRPDTQELISGLKKGNWDKILKNMINILEIVTLKEYCIVMYTKNMMQDCKPAVTLMSGSGPTIFGIFVDKASAMKAYNTMKDINEETYLVQTL